MGNEQAKIEFDMTLRQNGKLVVNLAKPSMTLEEYTADFIPEEEFPKTREPFWGQDAIATWEDVLRVNYNWWLGAYPQVGSLMSGERWDNIDTDEKDEFFAFLKNLNRYGLLTWDSQPWKCETLRPQIILRHIRRANKQLKELDIPIQLSCHTVAGQYQFRPYVYFLLDASRTRRFLAAIDYFMEENKINDVFYYA